jgi:hypothetical protein
MLANSPQVNDWGSVRLAIVDSSHRPLGSPCAAEIHESRVIGPDNGEPVASVSPRKVPTRTLPGLIGRDNQLLGRSAAVCCMLAARLPVREWQAGCSAHSAE